MDRPDQREYGKRWGEKKYTDDYLIDCMLGFYDKNGRAPTKEDFTKLSKQGQGTPSPSVYSSRGGWNHFLKRAGLPVTHRSSEGVDELNKPEYLRKFGIYLKEHTKAGMPNIKKDSALGLCPSPAVLQRLGGLENLRQHFGIELNKKQVSFNEKEINFLEGYLKEPNMAEAARKAGYKRNPVGQLVTRLNVNGIADVLEIYNKWKVENTRRTPESED